MFWKTFVAKLLLYLIRWEFSVDFYAVKFLPWTPPLVYKTFASVTWVSCAVTTGLSAWGWENSAVIGQARRDEPLPQRTVCCGTCVSSSPIHSTCHFSGETTGASLANHEWPNIRYFKNTSFGWWGEQLRLVQLVPVYIQESVCFPEPPDIPNPSGSSKNEEALAQ